MLEETTRHSLISALESLREDLKNKLERVKELEALKNECEWIQSLIRQIEDRVEMKNSEDIDFSAALHKQGLGLIEPKTIEISIHKGACQIYDELNLSVMKIPDIVKEFRRRNWKISPNHPDESIRNSFKRHPELFRKVGRGTWEKIKRIPYT